LATFFTSDHHFGDARRLGIDRRPFSSRDAMDAAMIETWNAVVRPGDDVWHLGDFARTGAHAALILAQLQGRKHLIAGNNDPPETLALTAWASVAQYAEMEVDGLGLVLCHYPFRTWNGMHRGRLNLHGHSHGRLKPMTRQYDVGVDVRDFRPVRLAEIVMSRRKARAPA
jgi:calcineurin-like phosphoesterase family protein